MHHLRLGTRGSLLARTQSQQVADALMKIHRGLQVDLVILKTSGDQIVDRPLHAMGGKGLFTKELELALLRGEIDFAVHSYKDVPVTQPLVDQSELTIAAVPKREDPSDVLVSRFAAKLEWLPANPKIGTGSLRRRSQILAVRPDAKVEMIRGNIDTRLRRATEDLDAVILAAAGLRRAGLFNEYCHPLSDMLPAAGQGALAMQCRSSDGRTVDLLRQMNDPETFSCVDAERLLVMKLRGDCHSPIAALATIAAGRATLRAAVARRGGEPPLVRAEAEDAQDRLPVVTDAVFTDLERQGALKLLHEA